MAFIHMFSARNHRMDKRKSFVFARQLLPSKDKRSGAQKRNNQNAIGIGDARFSWLNNDLPTGLQTLPISDLQLRR